LFEKSNLRRQSLGSLFYGNRFGDFMVGFFDEMGQGKAVFIGSVDV